MWWNLGLKCDYLSCDIRTFGIIWLMEKIKDRTVHKASVASRREIIFEVGDDHAPNLPEILRRNYCERKWCPFRKPMLCSGPNWAGMFPSLIGISVTPREKIVDSIEGPTEFDLPLCFIVKAFEEGKLISK